MAKKPSKKPSKKPRPWLTRDETGWYETFIDTEPPTKKGRYWYHGTEHGQGLSMCSELWESVIPKTGPRAKYRLAKGGGPVEVKLA